MGGESMTTERIEHPFANGTEGRTWESLWCEVCIHEHDSGNHGPDGVIGPGCPFICHALLGETPLIWQPYAQDWWHHLPAKIDCRAFEPCDCEYANGPEVRESALIRPS
jgi:hypothetical protein